MKLHDHQGDLSTCYFGHFFIPASSTKQGLLEALGLAGHGDGTGGLLCTVGAGVVSISIADSSFVITVEVLFVIVPSLAF